MGYVEAIGAVATVLAITGVVRWSSRTEDDDG